MMGKIKAILALLILCISVLSFFGSLILVYDGFHNISVINSNYKAETLVARNYVSRDMYGPRPNSVEGEINSEEKFLLVADSVISNQSPKSFLVFTAKGKAKTYHRQEGELELDKTPFKKRAAFCFIFPFIINPLLYFLWKILTKDFE